MYPAINAQTVRSPYDAIGDLISITLFPYALEGGTRELICKPYVVTVTVSKQKKIMAKSAKPAAKSKKAGASKPKKAQSYKAEASPKLTNRPGNSPNISAGMKRYWKQRKLKAKLR